MATTAIRVHLRIRGRVQGVFFRASAQQEAERLGLVGWVRNCEDGDVEAVAEGPEPAVERFIDWCRVGPRSARVDDVQVERETSAGNYSRFSIAPS